MVPSTSPAAAAAAPNAIVAPTYTSTQQRQKRSSLEILVPLQLRLAHGGTLQITTATDLAPVAAAVAVPQSPVSSKNPRNKGRFRMSIFTAGPRELAKRLSEPQQPEDAELRRKLSLNMSTASGLTASSVPRQQQQQQPAATARSGGRRPKQRVKRVRVRLLPSSSADKDEVAEALSELPSVFSLKPSFRVALRSGTFGSLAYCDEVFGPGALVRHKHRFLGPECWERARVERRTLSKAALSKKQRSASRVTTFSAAPAAAAAAAAAALDGAQPEAAAAAVRAARRAALAARLGPTGAHLQRGDVPLDRLDRAYFRVGKAYELETAPPARACDFHRALRHRYDPFKQAGADNPMYSFKSLLQRESIYFAPSVRKALDMILEVADEDGNRHIEEDEYAPLHGKMCLAMYGQGYLTRPHAERCRVLRDDWVADSDGHAHLDYQRFTFCWFQLADRFTDDIDEQQYADFLWDMLNRMALVNIDGKLRLRDDADIVPLGTDPGDTAELTDWRALQKTHHHHQPSPFALVSVRHCAATISSRQRMLRAAMDAIDAERARRAEDPAIAGAVMYSHFNFNEQAAQRRKVEVVGGAAPAAVLRGGARPRTAAKAEPALNVVALLTELQCRGFQANERDACAQLLNELERRRRAAQAQHASAAAAAAAAARRGGGGAGRAGQRRRGGSGGREAALARQRSAGSEDLHSFDEQMKPRAPRRPPQRLVRLAQAAAMPMAPAARGCGVSATGSAAAAAGATRFGSFMTSVEQSSASTGSGAKNNAAQQAFITEIPGGGGDGGGGGAGGSAAVRLGGGGGGGGGRSGCGAADGSGSSSVGCRTSGVSARLARRRPASAPPPWRHMDAALRRKLPPRTHVNVWPPEEASPSADAAAAAAAAVAAAAECAGPPSRARIHEKTYPHVAATRRALCRSAALTRRRAAEAGLLQPYTGGIGSGGSGGKGGGGGSGWEIAPTAAVAALLPAARRHVLGAAAAAAPTAGSASAAAKPKRASPPDAAAAPAHSARGAAAAAARQRPSSAGPAHDDAAATTAAAAAAPLRKLRPASAPGCKQGASPRAIEDGVVAAAPWVSVTLRSAALRPKNLAAAWAAYGPAPSSGGVTLGLRSCGGGSMVLPVALAASPRPASAPDRRRAAVRGRCGLA
ncbi:hypothetical protein JKP88DRAFT_312614 [Tribonema minus]|uniref:EF-hand domain-containing protein n=1 Tax=Tribonema minus TaxID=303371 RepID=A0A836CGS3_9STRA|nr:hypothetical protein JKP88DRAFT_312614 [Tribonema minus]